MYDMDMRQYDPAIARWVALDPIVHYNMSPYNAFDNNPVFWADPSGAAGEHYNWNNGKYEDDKGKEVSFGAAMASQGLDTNGNEQNSSGSTENEPPTNLFSKNAYTFNGVVGTAERNAKKGDGKYDIFGHGDNSFIANQNENYYFKLGGAYTPEQFVEMMQQINPELANALTSQKGVTITLYVCNTGSVDYISNGGKHVVDNDPIAKQISKAFPNATVIAPNGYVQYGLTVNNEFKIRGVRRNDNIPGSMLTFKNGEVVNTRIFNHDGPTNKVTKK